MLYPEHTMFPIAANNNILHDIMRHMGFQSALDMLW